MGLCGGKGFGVETKLKRQMSISPVCMGQLDWFRPEVDHAPQISRSPHRAANCCSAFGDGE